MYEDLAKSICAFLEKNPFVKIGVKGRPKGTSVASVVEQIEVFLLPGCDLILAVFLYFWV